MLREHKNRWLDIIKDYEVDLTNFEAIESDSGDFIINTKSSPFVFIVRQSKDDFDSFTTNYTLFKPGFPLRQLPAEFDNDESFYDEHSVDQQIHEWASNVRRYYLEQHRPDSWAQLRFYSFFSSTSSIPEDDLREFSRVEKIQIKSYLLEFEAHVIEKFDPVQEQLQFINERLEYLSKAVDRLNRFDWKAQAISTLTSIAINLGVDTEGGKKLWQLFIQGLEFLAKHLPSGL